MKSGIYGVQLGPPTLNFGPSRYCMQVYFFYILLPAKIKGWIFFLLKAYCQTKLVRLKCPTKMTVCDFLTKLSSVTFFHHLSDFLDDSNCIIGQSIEFTTRSRFQASADSSSSGSFLLGTEGWVYHSKNQAEVWNLHNGKLWNIFLICTYGEVKIIADFLYETKHNFLSCSFDIIAWKIIWTSRILWK